MEKQTYTIRECAKILGVGVSVMYESARQGKLPVLKFGRRLVVPKYEFHKMLQAPETQITRDSLLNDQASNIS
ncbi:helix-turn-helix domain-containing protein [Chloroflexota bacterium]